VNAAGIDRQGMEGNRHGCDSLRYSADKILFIAENAYGPMIG